MHSIRDRTFIISGGSSGLGLATAENLLEAGAYIAVFDLHSSPSSSSSVSSNPRVRFYQVDVTEVGQIEKALEEVSAWTRETKAHLGGVLNGAGGGSAEKTLSKNLTPHSVEHWEKSINLNLSGTFHLIRLAAKYLATVPAGEDGERGVMVMISSTAALEGQQGQIAYSAVKGAIISMTLPLARDLAIFGIRVVTIAPGVFRTPLVKQYDGRIEEGIKSRALLHPKRYGEPHEFAQTVRWILETPMVNGEVIPLTGGARYGTSRL